VREITYAAALSEGLVRAMEADPSIFVTGIGVDYSGGIFGTTLDARRQFGPKRVFDTPAMENALTGIAIGAAADGLAGARCVALTDAARHSLAGGGAWVSISLPASP